MNQLKFKHVQECAEQIAKQNIARFYRWFMGTFDGKRMIIDKLITVFCWNNKWTTDVGTEKGRGLPSSQKVTKIFRIALGVASDGRWKGGGLE